MGRELTIAETLFSYYQTLMGYYPTNSILGVFLFGSQNYNFDTPTSDIDAKAIYIPSREEMVNLKEPVSKVYGTEHGNIEVKDIRLMWKMWKKQNINFVEILFTDYYLTNKNYTNLWELIRTANEKIARYNPLYTVNSIVGQCRGTLAYKEITGKKVANVARLIDFLEKYLEEKSYRSCITVDEDFKKKWLHIKQENELFTKEDAEVMAQNKLTDLVAKGEELYKDKTIDNTSLDGFITYLMLEIIETRRKLEN